MVVLFFSFFVQCTSLSSAVVATAILKNNKTRTPSQRAKFELMVAVFSTSFEGTVHFMFTKIHTNNCTQVHRYLCVCVCFSRMCEIDSKAYKLCFPWEQCLAQAHRSHIARLLFTHPNSGSGSRLGHPIIPASVWFFFLSASLLFRMPMMTRANRAGFCWSVS